MKAYALLHASLQSRRLPRKVLAPIGGIPMVIMAARRIAKARTVKDVIVSIPTDLEDDELDMRMKAEGLRTLRTTPKSKTSQVLMMPDIEALCPQDDYIIRCTADNPFVDPELIDHCMDMAGQSRVICTRSDMLPGMQTPAGFDVECLPISVVRIHAEWEDSLTGIYAWICRGPKFAPELHIPELLPCQPGLSVTVDYYHDLQWVRKIYEQVPELSYRSIVRWWDRYSRDMGRWT